MLYRRRINSDTWHWMTACRNWPRELTSRIVEEVYPEGERPEYGELCNKCREREEKAHEKISQTGE